MRVISTPHPQSLVGDRPAQHPRLPLDSSKVSDLLLFSALEAGEAGADRLTVARAVLAVVAAYSYDDVLYGAALVGTWADPEDRPMAPERDADWSSYAATAEQFDLTDPVVVEEQVRLRAEDAECAGAAPGLRASAVVSTVLDGLGLLDDYLRIKNVEQHQAFACDPRTPAENDALARVLADRAVKAEASAQWRRKRRIEDAQPCRRGTDDRGTHDLHRRLDAELGPSRVWAGGRRRCTFEPLADAPARTVSVQRAREAVDAWAMLREIDLTAAPARATELDAVLRRFDGLRFGDTTLYSALDAAWALTSTR